MTDAQLAAIAAAVGTPVYVYDAGMIRERFAALTDALSRRLTAHVHYAVKANSNLAVLALMRELGAGADIVSAGELARARAVGFPPNAVVFSGVGKTDSELAEALAAGLRMINLESEGEAERVIALAAQQGVVARVGIRVNPEVTTETHPYTQTGAKGMKFGVPLDRVPDLARRLADDSHTTLVCVGMHIGSQITAGAPYRAGADRLASLVAALRAAGLMTLESVDVGGGLGIAYQEGAAALDPDVFAEAIAPLHDATGLPVLVEPGRYLVGPAGVLLTRVVYRKHTGGREFVIADAGMNDLLRPSLYQAEHPIRVVGAVPGATPEDVDVVGPICETGDFLGLRRRLAGAAPGALLAVEAAGAYGFSMSSQYNSRPRPAEVLVDGDRWGIVRERERVADLIRGETPTPRWVHGEEAA
ncbi:MAG: diaminopimelate decarboxylase [Gemmatimonadota bacterium]|nr:diaminopimelate decarboxylase [Gemmatimonadota bacterium]MDH4350375.1 diaminopimelate decarboxylase [Gemmatimonadota bacterium]MDH5198792.1 diaminopimelate decarboxylase [Gemmatimonadota bacterium]